MCKESGWLPISRTPRNSTASTGRRAEPRSIAGRGCLIVREHAESFGAGPATVMSL